MLRVAQVLIDESGSTGSWKARGRRAASCAALVLATSCGADPPRAGEDESPVTFVGAVEGTDAKIALVRDGSRWAAYVCGGPEALSSMTGWFEGARGPAKSFEVAATADGKELEATFTGDDVTGSLTVDGTATPFEAARVPQEGAAGLYQDDSNGCRSGLIVPEAGDGDPQGAYCVDLMMVGKPTARIFEQVTPIKPVVVRDGFLVARPVISTEPILHLRPILLPLASN